MRRYMTDSLIMHDLKWSASEKKIARRAYEVALEKALAGIMAEFKGMAASVETPSDMWDIEDYLYRRRREVDQIFDYRYSRLTLVFAQLIRDGHLNEAQLAGLSEEKLEIIRSMLRSVSDVS
jgi:hypothetical protein